MQDKIIDMLLDKDELSWKDILFDLVKNEQMDPWDIDITLLTKRFIQVIREMQEHDFKVPGKILLAAAVLLRMKATHLVENDISNLDRMISQAEEETVEEGLFEELREWLGKPEKQKFKLIPKNPQPRSRKVSIHDLIDALQRALATKKRILSQQRPVKFPLTPGKKVDIVEVIRDIYHKITYYSLKEGTDKITFTRLLPPKAGKFEKVYTFIPLLHLEHQKKIATEQRKHFDEIYISLAKKKAVEEKDQETEDNNN